MLFYVIMYTYDVLYVLAARLNLSAVLYAVLKEM